MLIKQMRRERAPLDIREWNEEVKAYVRSLDSFEGLVFNDYIRDFFDKNLGHEERFAAAFSAAKLALVNEENEPLLTDDDFEAVRYASFAPLFRMISVVLSETAPGEEADTAKKN